MPEDLLSTNFIAQLGLVTSPERPPPCAGSCQPKAPLRGPLPFSSMKSTPAEHRYETAGPSRNISLCFRQAIENKNKSDFILQKAIIPDLTS